MRVALICGYLDPTRDGVADYTGRLAVALRTAELDPLIVTTYELAAAAGTGAVGVARRWNVQGVVSAAAAVRRMKPDIVHVQFAPSVFGFSRAVGVLPLFLPKGLPLVVTLHEYGVWSGDGRSGVVRSALWSQVERRGWADRETLQLVPWATRLVVSSTEHLSVLRTRFPRRAQAAIEVPIGHNVELAAVDQAGARAGVRRQLGAAPDAPLVVFFGFLHPVKALDQLIAAVATVQAHRPETHLLLIGGAASHSLPDTAAHTMRRALRHVATACGVQDHVHITGYLRDAEVSRLLHAADVAAFPFKIGVTRKSSSLLTALAAGLPVVATASPGTIGELTEADGVLWVPPNDPEALTQALLRVLADGALAERLRVAGLARAASQSWDAIAATHADVYAQATAAPRDGKSWTGTAPQTRVVPSNTG